MKEFKSFFKTVGGGEGSKCHYPTRLDTYGCGCTHDCSYCYAKSLLSFRNLWNPKEPKVADIAKIEKVVKKLPKGSIVRLGGMTDCFMSIEAEIGVTLETIKLLNKYDIGYLIVTKSALVAKEPYISTMRKDLAHIQVSITHTRDVDNLEKASYWKARIEAVEKLQEYGFDVAVRLSPYLPEYIDVNIINSIRCDKLLVEFLRVNSWVKKWFYTDYYYYTHKEGGYEHLELERKIELLNRLRGGWKYISVCDDVQGHYEYFQKNFNSNPNDCCCLRVAEK